MQARVGNSNYQWPTREQIAERAYQIYRERGAQPGHEVDDWLQAEYELTRLPIRKIAGLEPAKPKGARSRKRVVASALVALVQAALWLGTSA